MIIMAYWVTDGDLKKTDYIGFFLIQRRTVFHKKETDRLEYRRMQDSGHTVLLSKFLRSSRHYHWRPRIEALQTQWD